MDYKKDKRQSLWMVMFSCHSQDKETLLFRNVALSVFQKSKQHHEKQIPSLLKSFLACKGKEWAKNKTEKFRK